MGSPRACHSKARETRSLRQRRSYGIVGDPVTFPATHPGSAGNPPPDRRRARRRSSSSGRRRGTVRRGRTRSEATTPVSERRQHRRASTTLPRLRCEDTDARKTGAQRLHRAQRIRAAASGSASSSPSDSPSRKHPRTQAAKTRPSGPASPVAQATTSEPIQRYPSTSHAPGGGITPTTTRAGGFAGSGAQSLAAARSGGTTTSVPSSVQPRGQVSTASQGHWHSSGRAVDVQGRGIRATCEISTAPATHLASPSGQSTPLIIVSGVVDFVSGLRSRIQVVRHPRWHPARRTASGRSSPRGSRGGGCTPLDKQTDARDVKCAPAPSPRRPGREKARSALANRASLRASRDLAAAQLSMNDFSCFDRDG